jgi:nucleotide-binding universal stress UspA family protein
MQVLERAAPVAATAVKNILFATDFSEASDAALPYVTAFSSSFGSQIHLTHVLPEVTLLRPGAPKVAVFGSLYEDARGSANEKMRRLSRRLKDYPHRIYVRHGEIPRVVAEMVRDQNIDLVIAGTHGRTGLGRLIMGSVAEEILRQAPCPVLTVGPNVVGAAVRALRRGAPGSAPATAEIRDILYGTDFQQKDAAVSLAASLARQFQAKLGLLHVIDDYGDRMNEQPGPIDAVMLRLRELITDDASLEHAPELLAQFGIPAESILQTAAERQTDLIILGARPANGRSDPATHLSGAIAHRIIVGANCPVLTVKA